MIQTLQKYSPEDMPFATEEDFDQIEWPKKEEYQQLLDEFKNKEYNNNNNLFLRSRPSQHTKLVYETPLFVGQGTPLRPAI
jgi:hypothetical protein